MSTGLMRRISGPGRPEAASVQVVLALADSSVGDLDSDAARIVECIREADSRGADLGVFPGLAIYHHPSEDLLLQPCSCPTTTLSPFFSHIQPRPQRVDNDLRRVVRLR